MPSTAYAVLGLLSFGRELTGYDLRKWAENLRFFYWSPAQSQIYTELRRLSRYGLVTERGEPQRGRPDKRYYLITDAGQRAFQSWLQHSQVDAPIIKHPVMLRLFFGHGMTMDRLSTVLTEYARWLQQQRIDLEQVHQALLPNFPFPHLVAIWGEAFYAAELTAVEAVLRELDKLPEAPLSAS